MKAYKIVYFIAPPLKIRFSVPVDVQMLQSCGDRGQEAAGAGPEPKGG